MGGYFNFGVNRRSKDYTAKPRQFVRPY